MMDRHDPSGIYRFVGFEDRDASGFGQKVASLYAVASRLGHDITHFSSGVVVSEAGLVSWAHAVVFQPEGTPSPGISREALEQAEASGNAPIDLARLDPDSNAA